MTADPRVSIDQTSVHLGVTSDFVYRWIDSKSLQAHRVGPLWNFKASVMDDWVRAGDAHEANRKGGKVGQ